MEAMLTGFVGQAILIVSGVLVARILGAEGRGNFALLTLFPLILTQAISLGVPQSIPFFLAKNRGHAVSVYAKLKYVISVQIALAVGLFAVVLNYYFAVHKSGILAAAYFMIVAIPSYFLQQYGLSIVQGLKQFRLFNYLRIISVLIFSSVLIPITAFRENSLTEIAFVWMAVQLLSGCVIFYIAQKQVFHVREQSTTEVSTIDLLRFGLKGMIGYSSPLQNYRLDQLFVGLFLTPASLGFYVVAQAFANLPHLVSISASMVAYPLIAAKKASLSTVKAIWMFSGVVSIICASIVILLFILMPVLITLFFGEEFEGSLPIARTLIVGAFFYSVRRAIVEGARGLGYPQVSTYCELALYPVLIIVAAALIPTFEIMGVALAVATANFVSCLVAIVLVIRVQKSMTLRAT